MGHEHEVKKLACGCEHHYEYDEYCAMGPVAGSQKRWSVLCQAHQKEQKAREVARLEQELAQAKAKLADS